MVDVQDQDDLWRQLEEVLSGFVGRGLELELVRSSFYEPLHSAIADSQLDAAWCSVAAHWLPTLPTKMREGVVGNQLPDGPDREAWRAAADRAWFSFLRLRAREVRSGGHLVVAMPGLDVEDGAYVATRAWGVFAEIKSRMLRDGEIDCGQAERLATREYWRTEAELRGPIEAEGSWAVASYELERKPCPFLTKLQSETDAMTRGHFAAQVGKAFQGFLSTEFNAALGAAAGAFWAEVETRAVQQADDLALHVVMHQVVLIRKD